MMVRAFAQDPDTLARAAGATGGTGAKGAALPPADPRRHAEASEGRYLERMKRAR